MKLFRSTTILLLAVLAISIAACSSNKAPVEPNSEIPMAFGVPMDDRNIIAVYDAVIDPEARTFTITPAERVGAYHFALTTMYPNVVSITGYGWTPNFWADIKLNHPFPGSGINGYDPRVIGVVPANAGVSFNYPTFNAIANNKLVMEPDGYTKLFDSLGGSIAGNTNPFKAYFKAQPYRVWSSTGATSETQRWNMMLSGFGGPIVYKLIVDVSTKYPAAPTPIVDNALEPVQLSPITIGSGLTPTGGSAAVSVTLLDWQGPSHLQGIGCAIEGPALFNSTVNLAYAGPGPNPNEYIFTGNISNTKGAPAGDYWCLVAGWDVANSLYMYKEAKATVAGGGGGGWILDPNRTNVDMSGFDMPPDPGSDLGVVDEDDPEIDGVRMHMYGGYECLVDLDLTNSIEWGYGYFPWDDNGADPHPNPDEVMPCVRIDANDNGATLRTWNDPHKGYFVTSWNMWVRNDGWLLFETYVAGFMEPLRLLRYRIGSNVPETTCDDLTDQFYVNEVWDEAEVGFFDFVLGAQWSGTICLDDTEGFPLWLINGGWQDPYWDGTQFTANWGAWSVRGLPADEIKGIDASQQELANYQYFGFSGDIMGPGIVGCYDKDWNYIDSYVPTSANANILDLELIPLQNPPLNINQIEQTQDWIALLLDDQTIEIINASYAPGGESVTILDCSSLVGDVKYLDIADNSASIFISHTDGTDPYCSVFILD